MESKLFISEDETIYLYKITNRHNSKIYVGVSNCVERRIVEHMRAPNRLLEVDVIKYGLDAFVMEVLSEGTQEGMLQLESEIVNSEFIESGMTYNIAKGGVIPPRCSAKSSAKSSQTRKRLISEGKIPKPPRYTQESSKKVGETLKRLMADGKISKPPPPPPEAQKRAGETRKRLHSEGKINLATNEILPRLYEWVHIDGRVVIRRQCDMTNEFLCADGNVCNVVKGRAKTVSGWRINLCLL